MGRGKSKATLRNAQRAASDLPDEFLACREEHQWRLFYVKRVRGGRDRGWFCPRCKSERYRFTDRQGYNYPATYKYPDGYLLQGLGRLSGDARAAIRAEMLDRMDDFTIDIKNLTSV